MGNQKKNYELKEELEIYKNICQNIVDPIIITDFKGKILFGNKAALKMFRIKNEKEVLKKRSLDFIAPESRKNVLIDYLNVLRGKEGYSNEHKVKDTKGREFWVESIGRKINFKGKKAVLTSLRDITERKKVEEKYQNLFNSSRDGIVFVNMAGTITDVNQAYCRILGYNEEQIKKLTYKQLTPQKWHKIESDIVKNQILKRGYSDEYEKEYIKKDGTVFPVSLKTWLIKDNNGKLVGMWAIVKDITERKKAEEELKIHTNELEKMNALMIGRELKMVELKKKTKGLESKLERYQ
jgi:PAS domain S-box-containing protein